MIGMEGAGPRASGKPAWQAPKLQGIGNLRSFVQSGNAFGKSGTVPDGCSDPGGEKMSGGHCM